MRWTVRGVLAVGVAVAVGGAAPARAGGGATERVSVGPGGAQGDEFSGGGALSAGGRFVAFSSYASNLVPGDTNGTWDVFVRDRRRGRTERVSVGRSGTQANSFSGSPVISADGRYVAFRSDASNLVLGDANGFTDVFVRDRLKGTTERVSVGSGGAQGDASSFVEAISADGRYVAFSSVASNLVRGDTNGGYDVFVRDCRRGTTQRVSVGPRGAQGNGQSVDAAISADGRYVTFASLASNLVPGDTNGREDVFVRDRWKGKTERVSVGRGVAQADGFSAAPAISADGRHVTFESGAANLAPGDANGFTDVFVRDRRRGRTELVSVGRRGAPANSESSGPVISAGGRYVAFQSWASNLVPGGTNGFFQVYVRDRRRGTTELVSVGPGGAPGDSDSGAEAISAGGRYVAFSSIASDLVPSDTNGTGDVFVRDRRRARRP